MLVAIARESTLTVPASDKSIQLKNQLSLKKSVQRVAQSTSAETTTATLAKSVKSEPWSANSEMFVQNTSVAILKPPSHQPPNRQPPKLQPPPQPNAVSVGTKALELQGLSAKVGLIPKTVASRTLASSTVSNVQSPPKPKNALKTWPANPANTWKPPKNLVQPENAVPFNNVYRVNVATRNRLNVQISKSQNVTNAKLSKSKVSLRAPSVVAQLKRFALTGFVPL